MVPGADSEDAATEERISQILSEAQAAMQKKHTDEQVCGYCLWPRIVFSYQIYSINDNQNVGQCRT